MPTITTADGTTLHYQDWGSGRPVVLLSTAMMNSRMWEFQAPHLASHGFRCVAHDRRGFGRSDWPWHGYDYDTLADDLAALLDQLDLREVTLVGYAMGGGEAVRYLSRHGSERIARLALVASTTPFLMRTADNPDGMDPADFEAVVAALRADRPRFLAQLAGPFFDGPGAAPGSSGLSEELVRWCVQLSLDSSPAACEAVYRTLFTEDFRAELPKVDVETLVLHGEADGGSPFALCAPPTARLITDSRLEVYERAAHGLFLTHADRLNADLRAFASG